MRDAGRKDGPAFRLDYNPGDQSMKDEEMIHETKATITSTDYRKRPKRREVTVYTCDECEATWTSEDGEPCEHGREIGEPEANVDGEEGI